MSNKHYYQINTQWCDNNGKGTSHYKSYSRNHSIYNKSKKKIDCSADPAFMGDSDKYNPEELLLASVSACHMLWYLHLCAISGVVVIDYSDNAAAVMEESGMKGGRFTSITLYPVVLVKSEDMIATALKLHEKANELCFIANTLNIKVGHKAVVRSF